MAVLPRGFGQSRRWWLIVLGLEWGSTLLIPQIDMIAHLAGLMSAFRGEAHNEGAAHQARQCPQVFSCGLWPYALSMVMLAGVAPWC